jgi:hypothetical protein
VEHAGDLFFFDPAFLRVFEPLCLCVRPESKYSVTDEKKEERERARPSVKRLSDEKV